MSQITYFSTNHKAAEVTFGEALLKGLAPDKGLFMPNAIPTFSKDELNALKGKAYYEIAAIVFSKFLGEEVPMADLLAMTKDAYNFDVPLENVIDRKYVMRLDQGPTASFKDFAGRMMGRMMQYFLKKQNVNKLILTATSGDTGSAMAHAFYGLNNIQIAVLFPKDEVSDRQRKQMTTLQKNVQIIAIDGKFDDAQAMVKQAFSDPDLACLNFTSANSINIGRLIPQIVYYIYSYTRLRKQDSNDLEEAVFCIPSGNFGDMMGCVLATKMGLPVKKILVATNENDEFTTLMNSHKYTKIEPSRNCLSSAMNVGHPSNLARLIELYGGNMDEKGNILKEPDFAAMDKMFYAMSVTDAETRATIKQAWDAYHVMLEPHGAVGWYCVEQYLAENDVDQDQLLISLETAHPAKFPNAIIDAIGVDPELPESLSGLEGKEEHFDSIEGNYPAFKEYLDKRYQWRK
ncbi:MAG: threonine synthase [Bacteroidales bacterium]|nr:threonine synthase [Bacteroidales bacterium]